MNDLYRLAWNFRNAMNQAKDNGIFFKVSGFKNFPTGSCGETCYLLAEYLLENGIYTNYVSGTKWPQTHAWLVVTDKNELAYERAEKIKHTKTIDNNIDTNGYRNILKAIQEGTISNIEYVPPDYASKLRGKTIIDITGDQFSSQRTFQNFDNPVYVGEMTKMHCLFRINNIHECTGLAGVGELNYNRLSSLYREIKRYIY